jgi:hypothetical protein
MVKYSKYKYAILNLIKNTKLIVCLVTLFRKVIGMWLGRSHGGDGSELRPPTRFLLKTDKTDPKSPKFAKKGQKALKRHQNGVKQRL